MEPDQRHRPLSDIYHAALEKPPAERDAFLTKACAGDDALRQEVESLLAYESASSQFLETPAAVVAVAPGGAAMLNRRLGPYTIVAPLGAGGMGEVYRARDTKLGRDVAIKILPSHFTDDPERRARFTREARTLATLNHPHIGAIYGLEEADGVTGIVLELVEGPTLADRLERGPLKIAAALVIARQIADALNEAHEHGIIHRDLKPANIVLQGKTDLSPGDVRVKVLDFGLAKPMTVDLAAGPTAAGSGSFDGTADGRILGTPAYMSPEQARGQTVDKRTDIWAFGCVFFEMLSGRRAFDGDTVTDTLASVLEHEPDWTALPHETPEVMRKLLRRCLQKDPRRRLHDIADASIQSDDDSSRQRARRVSGDTVAGGAEPETRAVHLDPHRCADHGVVRDRAARGRVVRPSQRTTRGNRRRGVCDRSRGGLTIRRHGTRISPCPRTAATSRLPRSARVCRCSGCDLSAHVRRERFQGPKAGAVPSGPRIADRWHFLRRASSRGLT